MEESTIVLIVSFVVIGIIAAVCVWVVVKDRRYFKKMHPQLVDRFDAVATVLGLTWVVPIDHVREKRMPPALTGKHDGRDVYVALQDESDEESLRAKWNLVVHIGVGRKLVPRKERKPILKSLKHRGGEAVVKKNQLAVQGPGLQCTADEIVARVQECIGAADRLDGGAS